MNSAATRSQVHSSRKMKGSAGIPRRTPRNCGRQPLEPGSTGRPRPGINLRADEQQERTNPCQDLSSPVGYTASFAPCRPAAARRSVGLGRIDFTGLESLEGRALMATINASGVISSTAAAQLQLHDHPDERQLEQLRHRHVLVRLGPRRGFPRHQPDLGQPARRLDGQHHQHGRPPY